MNNQQSEYIETYKKRQNDSIIFKAAFLIGIIVLRMMFMSNAYSSANEAKASAKKELIGPGFQLSIEINGDKKSIYLELSRYIDMEFSPSGRYLLVEAENGAEYQMYIFDTNFIADSAQYYLVYDDLNMMVEWILRRSEMLEIKNDDTVSVEFVQWNDTEDYMNFKYAVTSKAGNTKTGEALIDYTAKTVKSVL